MCASEHYLCECGPRLLLVATLDVVEEDIAVHERHVASLHQAAQCPRMAAVRSSGRAVTLRHQGRNLRHAQQPVTRISQAGRYERALVLSYWGKVSVGALMINVHQHARMLTTCRAAQSNHNLKRTAQPEQMASPSVVSTLEPLPGKPTAHVLEKKLATDCASAFTAGSDVFSGLERTGDHDQREGNRTW